MIHPKAKILHRACFLLFNWKRPHNLRMSCHLAVCVILLVCPLLAGFGNSIVAKNKKGNEHYAKEEYNDAYAAYQDAMLDEPDSPQLHYNIGNVLYRAQQRGEAVEHYRKALSSPDRPFLQSVHYNIGNAQFLQGQLSEALDSYKEALKLDPSDLDAKFNLELTQARLKDQSQQQQRQQELGKKQQQTQQEELQRQQAQEKKSLPEEQEDDFPGDLSDEAMSQEDALRILDALKEEEKKAQKSRQVVPKMGSVYVERDW